MTALNSVNDCGSVKIHTFKSVDFMRASLVNVCTPLQSIGLPMSLFKNAGTQLPLEAFLVERLLPQCGIVQHLAPAVY